MVLVIVLVVLYSIKNGEDLVLLIFVVDYLIKNIEVFYFVVEDVESLVNDGKFVMFGIVLI